MTHYQIENVTSGTVLGTYEGETPEEAIAAMLRDAGGEGPASPDLVAIEVPCEAPVTVTYSYADSAGRHRTGAWVGDRAEALCRAVEALDARETDTQGEYRYRAEETGSEWLVPEADLVRLGAALLDGHAIAGVYSLWCAETVMDEVEDAATVRTRDGREVTLEVGDWIEVGEGEDYDRGEVVGIQGDRVEVAWRYQGESRTTQPVRALDGCVVYSERPAESEWAGPFGED